MANIILFDNEVRDRLLPLTYTRPACELRVGILRIREKWERWLNGKIAYITQDYLAEKYPIDHGKVNYIINGSVMPSPQLVRLIKQMEFNEAFLRGEELIVAKLDEEQIERLIEDDDIGELRGFDLEGTDYIKLDNLWDIYGHNARAIEDDFELLTRGRQSEPLSDTNRVVGPKNRIFLEEGAKAECCTFNTEAGPIYIGKNAQLMEGCLIRGGLAVCEGAVLKMGTKAYGATTIGPYSTAGGEIKNSVIMAYSNKGHEGYLGNSVLGEWCNLGADTNVSNLKNSYEEVKLWSYPEERFVKTGQQFCGLFMGDHSKAGINTMFNTGTVVGICCNLYGEGFPRNFIPSFSLGGKQGFQTFDTGKAIETAERVMARRNVDLDIPERLILLRIYEDTARFRRWEKS
ncbi:MAG: GlmU family protein [Phaeodactylibacter sp.]|nr:GlmU family protein [Phaeodactylibacter sp.]HQU58954.1 GlmU family protein [Saprospiraceae bacterium]